ncbi:MAG: (Fe-S)-binding protein [Longimicrobiales bacterium]
MIINKCKGSTESNSSPTGCATCGPADAEAPAPQRYSYNVEQGGLKGENKVERFLEAFAAILRRGNYNLALDTWSRLSMRCGRCSASCQVYEATGDPEDLPCHRSELLLRVYRRYFTQAGPLKARLFGGFTLTEEYIDEMAEAFYRCTACRRCRSSCPMGIDHGLITHLARWILAEIGLVPRALVVATREQLEGESGNTSAIPVPALKDSVEFLEEEFEDLYDVKISFPFDVEGAEYIFFPAVSDYIMEADTLMGNAALLQAAGVSWTIGTGNFDGINYGLFFSDRLLERIVRNMVAEARRLGAKKILIGECGHATRAAWYIRSFCGPDAPEVVNCLELAHQQLEAGKIPLKEERIQERVTYHDPCNIARGGQIVDQPRDILKAVCADFVEMSPNREENYCCGGGGGTVSIDELREFRTSIAGRRKAEQIRATDAEIVVSPCANCKKQLKELLEDNDLEHVQVKGVHDLLLEAIDFRRTEGTIERTEETPEEPAEEDREEVGVTAVREEAVAA